AGNCSFDGGGGLAMGGAFAAVEAVHRRVGVMDRHAGFGEQAGGDRLAHADRTGEAEDEHHTLALMSASIIARSSGVTRGVTPNQRANAGTAWCSSMPSPSTVRWPRSRAARSSAVSSATETMS